MESRLLQSTTISVGTKRAFGEDLAGGEEDFRVQVNILWKTSLVKGEEVISVRRGHHAEYGRACYCEKSTSTAQKMGHHTATADLVATGREAVQSAGCGNCCFAAGRPCDGAGRARTTGFEGQDLHR